jgi:hypothetical protein
VYVGPMPVRVKVVVLRPKVKTALAVGMRVRNVINNGRVASRIPLAYTGVRAPQLLKN